MNPASSTLVFRTTLALGFMFMAVSGSAPARAQNNALGTWIMKAPMPEGARGEVAAAVYQGRLYAIGGNVASNAVPRNAEYDPATNRWRVRARRSNLHSARWA